MSGANTVARPAWWQYRWLIAVMLCLVTTINYIDRIALSVAAPLILEDFSISLSQYGTITSAFLLAYAIGQIFVGPLIDRLGSKRAFGLAVVVWSIAGMLHAVTRGFASLLTYRVLLGLGEAANFPAALKVVAEWFPRSERSLAVGIVTVGPGLGSMLAPPVVEPPLTPPPASPPPIQQAPARFRFPFPTCGYAGATLGHFWPGKAF